MLFDVSEREKGWAGECEPVWLMLRVDNVWTLSLHFLCVVFFIENEDEFEGGLW